MKILHILDHSLPLHSGYAFRSQNIFREQQKRGWQPVIVTSSKHEQSSKGPWQKEEEIEGFRYYRTGRISYNGIPFEAEGRLVAALGRRMMEVAKREKPDILHAHSPFLNAIPALWVGRKLNIPLVYEIRAFWEDAGVDHGTYTQDSAKYRLVKSIETWVCRRADYVGVLCNGLRKELIKRGIPANKISVVYNGVNPDNFLPGRPDTEFAKSWNLGGKKVIGFIGSFYRYEGLDLLVHAFSHLASSLPSLPASQPPSIILLLVGGGEVENELKDQIQHLGLALQTDAGKLGGWNAGALQGNVIRNPKPETRNTEHVTRNSEPTTRNPQHRTRNVVPVTRNPKPETVILPRVLMPGRIPHERIAGVYALVDILAYPRYSMRLTELVTPLKPLEAMAMGKALVASDVGGHKELIRDGETGLLFPAGNAAALAESLHKLIQDNELRDRLASQGREWVRKNHSWEKTTSVYEEIYRKVLP
jgi:PEP-CTERM/exosortase A-associated glycosyltransferase